MSYFNSFDNKKIFYKYVEGSLPYSVLFLHGWTAHHKFYEFLRKDLKDFNFFYWDARSHGESDVVSGASVNDMARDLKYFIDNVYDLPHPLILVGHSMGALTIFEYIKNFECRGISKIVVIDQSPKLSTNDNWNLGIYGNYTPGINRELVTEFKKDLGEGVIKLGARGLNKPFSELFKRNPEAVLKKKRTFASKEQELALIDIWETLVDSDFRPVIPKINVPVSLLYGKRSEYYVEDTAHYMKKNIKDSELTFFDRGGHGPFNDEPEKFCKVLNEFVLK